jgi:hypothetical protein
MALPETADNQEVDGREFLLMGGYIVGSVLELSAVANMIGGASMQEIKPSVVVGAVVLSLTELGRRITQSR